MQLADVRSAGDKSFTLLHYIADTVRSHYPSLLGVVDELKFMEKAGAGDTAKALTSYINPTYPYSYY